MIIFKTKDESEKEDIADSCAGEISKETFLKVYDEAIGDGSDHPFLFVDLHRKPSHASNFRRRFNEFLII